MKASRRTLFAAGAALGALGLGAWLLAGASLEGVGPALIAALLVALTNALIRPLLLFLTLPTHLALLGPFTLLGLATFAAA